MKSQIAFQNFDPSLREAFRAKCKTSGYSMTQAILYLMNGVISERLSLPPLANNLSKDLIDEALTSTTMQDIMNLPPAEDDALSKKISSCPFRPCAENPTTAVNLCYDCKRLIS